MGCETTYAFIYRAAPTGRAVMALSTRRHKRRRPSQDIIKDHVVRSDRTRAAQVHHFRLRPARLAATCAAMTTRFSRGLGLVGQGRGRKRRGRLRRWLPRQTDIDQVSDEESGRGRNRPIRSLPVRNFCSGAYTHGRPVLFPWLSHYAPSEVLLKRKPRGQSRHAISEFVEIKFRLDGG